MRLFLAKQLTRFFRFRHWRSLAVFSVFVSTACLLFVHGASAADGIPIVSDVGAWFMDSVIKIILVFARLCIGMSVAFLHIFMEIAAYNGYIDAPPVILGWFMVRDFANMFFVIALLVIAFGTILGLEQYEWKKSLVKLVLAAILINFSRLLLGIIIDASHIFTITFLNAVEGAAAGNVIGMLHLDKILQLVSPGAESAEDVRLELLLAAMAGAIFALISAAAILAYAIVMAIRVVTLWVMIILSPLVFLLSAIPQGKSYADQFWQEFTQNIIVAPMMVFFLWIAFASFGAGDINNHVGVRGGGIGSADAAQILDIPGSASPAVSIAEITTWENMSSFIIAVTFLFFGLVMVQRVGAIGGNVVGGVLTFSKQVATIASGYAAGRFLVGAATRGAKTVGKGVGLVAYKATGLEGLAKRTKNWGARQYAGFDAWRYATGGRTIKTKPVTDEKTGKIKFEADLDANGDIQYEDVKLGTIQKFFQNRELKNLASEKKLEKTQKFAEVRKKSLEKDVKGIPTYLLQQDYEKVDALDRFEQGKLKAKEERSAAKTEYVGGAGALAEKGVPRAQFEVQERGGAVLGTILPSKVVGVGKQGKTLSEEIQENKLKAERVAAELAKGGAATKLRVAGTKEGLKIVQGTAAAQLETQNVQAKIKELEANAAQSVAEKLPELIASINLAEQGTAAADAFTKRLKDANLKEQFKEAAKGINAAAILTDKSAREAAFQNLSDKNAFVRALRETSKQGRELEALAFAKTQAQGEAEGAFIEPGLRGYTTPNRAPIAIAERSAADLNSLTNRGQASALVNTLGLIAEELEKSETGELDDQIKAYAYGTLKKVNGEGYIDDALGQLADLLNRFEAGELKGEEADRALALQKVWKDQLKVIVTDEKTGKLVGGSKDRTARILQNYVISGGDAQLVLDDEEVAAYKDEQNVSYEEAAKKTLQDRSDAFIKKLNKSEAYLQDAAGGFLAQGLATTHYQTAGNQRFDEGIGSHRFATPKEKNTEIASQLVKAKDKLGVQYQGLGTVSNGILKELVRGRFGATIGSALKSGLDLKNVKDRTRDGLLGYAPGQEKVVVEGYGQLGASLKDIEERFGNVETYIRQLVIPELAEGAVALALLSASKFNNEDVRPAARGALKVEIPGTGIKANDVVDLIEKIGKRYDFGEFKEQIEATKAAVIELRNKSEEPTKKKKGT